MTHVLEMSGYIEQERHQEFLRDGSGCSRTGPRRESKVYASALNWIFCCGGFICRKAFETNLIEVSLSATGNNYFNCSAFNGAKKIGTPKNDG